MIFSKKIRLLSVLSAAIASTYLVETSCAAFAKNSNESETNGTDINSIQWIWRSKYDYTEESQIKARFMADNTSIFARYPGLQEAVTVTVSIGEDNITITIDTIEGSAYTGTVSKQIDKGEEPTPAGGTLRIDTSSIVPNMDVGDDAKSFTCTVLDADGNTPTLSSCTVESNNTDVLTVSDAIVSGNTVSFQLEPSKKKGGCVGLRIQVEDSNGNSGFINLVFQVFQRLWTHTYYINGTGVNSTIMTNVTNYAKEFTANDFADWLDTNGYTSNSSWQTVWPCLGKITVSSTNYDCIGMYCVKSGNTRTLYFVASSDKSKTINGTTTALTITVRDAKAA